VFKNPGDTFLDRLEYLGLLGIENIRTVRGGKNLGLRSRGAAQILKSAVFRTGLGGEKGVHPEVKPGTKEDPHLANSLIAPNKTKKTTRRRAEFEKARRKSWGAGT